MKNTNELTIDGTVYIRKDSVRTPAENTDGLPYVIIRSRDSGVHAGYLKKREGGEVVLLDARRIWYWKGAATLSQLSQQGVSCPAECKFPESVPSITILGVCEILPATEEAQKSIAKVTPWKE